MMQEPEAFWTANRPRPLGRPSAAGFMLAASILGSDGRRRPPGRGVGDRRRASPDKKARRKRVQKARRRNRR